MAQNMTGGNTTDKISGVEDEKSLASGYVGTSGEQHGNDEGGERLASGYYPGPGECEDD